MALPDNTTTTISSGDTEPVRYLQPVPEDGDSGGRVVIDQPDHDVAEPDSSTNEPDGDNANEPDEAVESTAAETGWMQQWFTDVLAPQSGLWTDRQPSVRDTVLRAKHGTQTAETGLVHTAHVVDSWITAGGKIVLRSAEWVWDHPARRMLTLVLLGLLILFPATRIGLGGLLWPLAQFDQWLLAN